MTAVVRRCNHLFQAQRRVRSNDIITLKASRLRMAVSGTQEAALHGTHPQFQLRIYAQAKQSRQVKAELR